MSGFVGEWFNEHVSLKSQGLESIPNDFFLLFLLNIFSRDFNRHLVTPFSAGDYCEMTKNTSASRRKRLVRDEKQW